MTDTRSGLADLDARSREIFRQIVETYLATGEPVGSRNLSRHLPMTLSPASVRNVMSDLESLGLIYAPHTSAGRLPTQTGLRMFVDGLMEVGDLSDKDRQQIETQVKGRRQTGKAVVSAQRLAASPKAEDVDRHRLADPLQFSLNAPPRIR